MGNYKQMFRNEREFHKLIQGFDISEMVPAPITGGTESKYRKSTRIGDTEFVLAKYSLGTLTYMYVFRATDRLPNKKRIASMENRIISGLNLREARWDSVIKNIGRMPMLPSKEVEYDKLEGSSLAIGFINYPLINSIHYENSNGDQRDVLSYFGSKGFLGSFNFATGEFGVSNKRNKYVDSRLLSADETSSFPEFAMHYSDQQQGGQVLRLVNIFMDAKRRNVALRESKDE